MTITIDYDDTGSPALFEYERKDGERVQVSFDDEAGILRALEELEPNDPAKPLLRGALDTFDRLNGIIKALREQYRAARSALRVAESRPDASVLAIEAAALRDSLTAANAELVALRSENERLRAAKTKLREALNRTKERR